MHDVLAPQPMSPEEIADLVRRAQARGDAIADVQRLHQKLIAAQRNAQPQASLTAHMLDDATIKRLAATTVDSAIRKACNSALHSASAKVRRRMRGRIATILNSQRDHRGLLEAAACLTDRSRCR